MYTLFGYNSTQRLICTQINFCNSHSTTSFTLTSDSNYNRMYWNHPCTCALISKLSNARICIFYMTFVYLARTHPSYSSILPIFRMRCAWSCSSKTICKLTNSHNWKVMGIILNGSKHLDKLRFHHFISGIK